MIKESTTFINYVDDEHCNHLRKFSQTTEACSNGLDETAIHTTSMIAIACHTGLNELASSKCHVA